MKLPAAQPYSPATHNPKNWSIISTSSRLANAAGQVDRAVRNHVIRIIKQRWHATT